MVDSKLAENAIGKTLSSPEVQDLLTKLGATKAPKSKPTEPKDFVSNKSLGIELTFTDLDYFEGRRVKSDIDKYTGNEMVLTGVTFYAAGGEKGFAQFASPLPLGLAFTSSVNELVGKLGPPRLMDEEAGIVYSRNWNLDLYGLTFKYDSSANVRYVQLVVLPASTPVK